MPGDSTDMVGALSGPEVGKPNPLMGRGSPFLENPAHTDDEGSLALPIKADSEFIHPREPDRLASR